MDFDASTDPAAEFLAREQDQLAGIGDDIISSTEPMTAPTGQQLAPPHLQTARCPTKSIHHHIPYPALAIALSTQAVVAGCKMELAFQVLYMPSVCLFDFWQVSSYLSFILSMSFSIFSWDSLEHADTH